MSIRSRIGTVVRGCRTALVISTVSVVVAGCVTQEALVDTPPSVGVVSRPNDDLRRLPQPEKKTVVAVYAYNDLTGQYKERDNVQSLSRAVTQGGAPMLVKALQDAGEGRWFTVVERAQLDNLLRERQILTEMRRIYRNETKVNAGVLPPLMHASIIVEGGIIGYDTNTITGGAGARFLNIGANTKYIQDVVTVTLRAVSIKSGEVLATVTARKAVASYALQGGAFRYLKLDELLEAEAGITYNEPKQIATESAIESAVKSLIIEGTMVGVWSFADEETGRDLVANYLEQKYKDKLTPVAENPVAAQTPKASSITTTVPASPVRVSHRSSAPVKRQSSPPAAAPSQAAPKPDVPPAPGKEETLGYIPAVDMKFAAVTTG